MVTELNEGTLYYSEKRNIFHLKEHSSDDYLKSIDSIELDEFQLESQSIEFIMKDADSYSFRIIKNCDSLALKISMKLVGGGSRPSKARVNPVNINPEQQTQPPSETPQEAGSKQINPELKSLETKHEEKIRNFRMEYESKLKELEQVVNNLKMGNESQAKEIKLYQEKSLKGITEIQV